MKVSDELKQRIKQLEIEQERQQKELIDLEQLRDLAAIQEMEKELANINADFAPLVNLDKNTQDVDLTQEFEELQEGDSIITNATTLKIHDIDLTEELAASSRPKIQGKGFIVLLMFDPKSPTEWSEQSSGGWRGKGQGTVYSTQAEANAMLKKLKQKWPDYPLKVSAN